MELINSQSHIFFVCIYYSLVVDTKYCFLFLTDLLDRRTLGEAGSQEPDPPFE